MVRASHLKIQKIRTLFMHGSDLIMAASLVAASAATTRVASAFLRRREDLAMCMTSALRRTWAGAALARTATLVAGATGTAMDQFLASWGEEATACTYTVLAVRATARETTGTSAYRQRLVRPGSTARTTAVSTVQMEDTAHLLELAVSRTALHVLPESMVMGRREPQLPPTVALALRAGTAARPQPHRQAVLVPAMRAGMGRRVKRKHHARGLVPQDGMAVRARLLPPAVDLAPQDTIAQAGPAQPPRTPVVRRASIVRRAPHPR